MCGNCEDEKKVCAKLESIVGSPMQTAVSTASLKLLHDLKCTHSKIKI